QRRRMEDAMALQLSRGMLSERAPLIGAGCGRFLVERLAASLGRPYRDFAELIEVDASVAGQAADCAPAVAVALLMREADVSGDGGRSGLGLVLVPAPHLCSRRGNAAR